MAVIGVFQQTKEGGWSGAIRTLTIDVKVRLVPNDNRTSEAAPAFRLFAGESEVGAAWRAPQANEQSPEYLRVQLVDPTWGEPLVAALFPAKSGADWHLIWSRKPTAARHAAEKTDRD